MPIEEPAEIFTVSSDSDNSSDTSWEADAQPTSSPSALMTKTLIGRRGASFEYCAKDERCSTRSPGTGNEEMPQSKDFDDAQLGMKLRPFSTENVDKVVGSAIMGALQPINTRMDKHDERFEKIETRL